MNAARFVTICLIYCGTLLTAQFALLYEFRLDFVSVTQLLTGLVILAGGVYRWHTSDETAHSPEQYGVLAYSLAVLSVLLTAIIGLQVVTL